MKKNFPPKKKILIEKPSETELSTFYSSLRQSEKNPAILRILPGFADNFKPDAIQYENKLLTKLYSEELVNLSFEDLLIKCSNIYETITITQKEALNTESQTRNQAKNSKWYELRAGQITASVMKAANSTKIDSPSLSFLKKICFRCKFKNVATDWGIEHEKPAKDCYCIQNSKNHSNFTI